MVFASRLADDPADIDVDEFVGVGDLMRMISGSGPGG